MLTVSWRPAAIATVLALGLAVPGSAATGTSGADRHGGHECPDRIELPDGWQPEGVTTDGKRLYAGSLADGRLLTADPRSGRVRVLPLSGADGPAVGVDHDKRRDLLWVAGGPTGEIRVHKASNGKLLRTYTMPVDPEGRFVNDLVVTRDGVYATDSFNAELAVVALDGSRSLPPSGETEVLPLSGDFQLGAGFNLNGIVASDGWLVSVQSTTGTLFRVDPGSGATTALDLGGASVPNGDGLELDGDDLLYVVRNQDNLVVPVDLEDDLTAGEVGQEITSGDLDVPATVALVRHSLYAANARFGTPPTPDTEYWLTRLPEAD